jgi:hypothetical protein
VAALGAEGHCILGAEFQRLASGNPSGETAGRLAEHGDVRDRLHGEQIRLESPARGISHAFKADLVEA